MALCLSISEAASDYHSLIARSSAYEGYKVCTVRVSSDKDVRVLRNIEETFKDGFEMWSDYFQKGDVLIFHVKSDYIPIIREILKRHSIRFQVHKDNVDQTIRGEVSNETDSRYDEFGYNYAKHNPFIAMFQLLKGLTDTYRRISRLETVGYTVERRPILAVHISKSRLTKKPAILIECGAHAREWSAFEACLYFTSMDRMWRKNRACYLPQDQCLDKCVGVDINRNFDVEFCQDSISSKDPCTSTFCGISAFSERESLAIKKMVARLKNRLLAYFCFHSFMGVWTYPWAKKRELPPNYREMARVARVAVNTVQNISNSVYRIGNIARVIYSVTGSSVDYAYDSGQAKYAYAIELRQGKEKTGFIMKEKEILPLCRETFAALVNSILAMCPDRN
ncbi:Mast cell carboxypeptidase A-like protein [Argiope bruennichi]|uniref:Mast cell carboxypeptidase A-like protein n=1 Tax=Argiope bruennichi TaxID=94029 RepID=A0A8T0EUZ7_ARGBR|nr:Mast cell carboxypeptidase A-like protein [Argiope bruennichi]